MLSSGWTNRMRRLAATSAVGVALVLGTASAAGAQDDHSGGVSPNEENVDPGGTDVLDNTIQRDTGGGLPITGSDVTGLVIVGAVAIGVGTSAVAASRRRSTRTPA